MDERCGLVADLAKSGDYVLVAEKNGRQFAPLSIQLKGKIVDPIDDGPDFRKLHYHPP